MKAKMIEQAEIGYAKKTAAPIARMALGIRVLPKSLRSLALEASMRWSEKLSVAEAAWSIRPDSVPRRLSAPRPVGGRLTVNLDRQ